MTETTLKTYLKLSGWMAILAVFVNFGLAVIERNRRMIEFGADSELRNETNAIHAIGFGIELPLMLALACLCLMAAHVMTYKTQTLKSIFE